MYIRVSDRGSNGIYGINENRWLRAPVERRDKRKVINGRCHFDNKEDFKNELNKNSKFLKANRKRKYNLISYVGNDRNRYINLLESLMN